MSDSLLVDNSQTGNRCVCAPVFGGRPQENRTGPAPYSSQNAHSCEGKASHCNTSIKLRSVQSKQKKINPQSPSQGDTRKEPLHIPASVQCCSCSTANFQKCELHQGHRRNTRRCHLLPDRVQIHPDSKQTIDTPEAPTVFIPVENCPRTSRKIKPPGEPSKRNQSRASFFPVKKRHSPSTRRQACPQQ